ncbi:MAG TPA: electron transfer flavoprotein subunit alpha/FixB family protein [Desulfatiglandales bacterium]|nr:electron transfer flavoprotein subunit alpha/FixB family protein [Desulfatiglandales bacterium]
MKRKERDSSSKDVWIFGDYRNYFQNRVTLQLIAKGRDLARNLGGKVTVLVLGEQVHQYAMEYVAHGADAVMVVDHPNLKDFQVETYTRIVASLVGNYRPDIFLAGATPFGREFFPRVAKRLKTGLSTDCIALEIDPENQLLLQTTPSFGGELLAEVITQNHRPQMATVHPGVFEEQPHDHQAIGRIIYPEVDIARDDRVQLVRSRPEQSKKGHLEDAPVVVVGGRGVSSKEQFQMLSELAELLGGEVGATRPAVLAGLAGEERLLGQTGKKVKPKLLITVGTSGALQYTTGIQGAETIIAINRDAQAPIFKMADLGLVGDARSILTLVLEKLRKRI